MAKGDNKDGSNNGKHRAIPTSRVGRFARVARMASGVPDLTRKTVLA
jgi:hypothetical protein